MEKNKCFTNLQSKMKQIITFNNLEKLHNF